MIKTIQLSPGVTLRCFSDTRFKQGSLTIQFLRPMCREEAALNALIPAVLLRGCRTAPDMQAITLRLDDLYGAAVGAAVRRVGDYQTTGLGCNFIEDKYALEGDRILEPMVDFLSQLLLEPALEKGIFREDYVQSEKRNQILTIEAQRNDKRLYANSRMLELMCARDSFGLPRLGRVSDVEAITAESAYAHYQKVLRESPVHVFYVGSAQPEKIAQLLTPLFHRIHRQPVQLPQQSAYRPAECVRHTEALDVTQGKLCMGFFTPITLRNAGFAAMQVLNMIFGGGMTNKLFLQIREKQSLCYDISSGYHGSKGILAVSAGIDFQMAPAVEAQVLAQLDACRRGDFTQAELESGKQALISQLRSTHDSPGSIENYYAAGALSGFSHTPQQYIEAVEAVTARDVVQAAESLQLHTVYFLKGVE